jgi:hypothetical protein
MVLIRPRVQHAACNCSRHGGTFPVLARAACAKVRAGIGDLVAEGKYFQRKLAHRRRHRRRRRKRIVQRLGRKTMKVTGIKEMERGPTSLLQWNGAFHLCWRWEEE